MRPPTMADAARARLEAYEGENIWQDVIVDLPGYDEEATGAADPSYRSDIAVFEDGSQCGFNGAEWEVLA